MDVIKVSCTLILFFVLMTYGSEYRVPMNKEKIFKRAEGRLKALRIRSGTGIHRGVCQKSHTMIRGGGSVCTEDIIFEENFNTFRSDVWQIEQYLPIFSEEFPFASYQRSSVSIQNGYLRITLQEQAAEVGFTEHSLFNGKLDLSNGCTSDINCCSMQASNSRGMLPPIITGRINSKFAFTYGIVHIRAKLPQGDWIYPELLLKPFIEDNNKFGIIKIASAFGNKNLKLGNTSYSNWVLTGGPSVEVKCQEFFQNNKKLLGNFNWGADFHVFSVKWAPESITLSVDSKVWALVLPQSVLAKQHLVLQSITPNEQCRLRVDNITNSESSVAPFNNHFYITLGVGVGGMKEFPDGAMSNDDHPKPWVNTSPRRKAMVDFWNDRNSWRHTWNQPELVVDYVKVIAL